MVLLQPPGHRTGSGVNGCFHGITGQPHRRGRAHVQLLGPWTQGLRLWVWGKHIHIWLISKLLSVGSIFSSQKGEKVVTFFLLFHIKILWIRSAAGTALRPQTLIHQPQDKQQSSRAVRAWNPEAVTAGTQLNSLDPQSNVLESNLMTEAIFIWTSIVLSTPHISIFIGILQIKQEFSRQYQDAVVADLKHTVLSMPERTCNRTAQCH